MLSKLQKDNKGFTIIEVLIVLAIAGLIMLIVFLAVPALQRNQRNNARNNDASRVAAAVTECLANRNGVVDSCNDNSEIQYGQLSRLDSAVDFPASLPATGWSQTQATVGYGVQCDADGNGWTAGGGNRAFVVLYQLEPNIDRCISS